ncbi:plasma membrane amino acid transmembrane transporter Per1 [Schizosaccharomyces osmophilus]|uniref:Plasma membrane amino acid transmembrane transporter Per1 n=1 Tax=Schizosaccharomyces osmophilus TaxID=2545709 RepID=A0AAE9WCJ6_9SCHI|nr:plasma membrane amino acid transmembrane transporter Per1 [Schizosaccharomyces osmophilus]WBW73665.1 plasma membrane amino acid transmembrane transporter Per1 [Schizosaccharomyces osmophilus]
MSTSINENNLEKYPPNKTNYEEAKDEKKVDLGPSDTSAEGELYELEPEKEGFFRGIINDFKPATSVRDDGVGLKRSLKGRHMQMIAIGGAIGTGLFVGSGSSLATGGPASVIINYTLIGIMMFCTVYALGELAVAYPLAGGFYTYCMRFIDPGWGFACGWNYFFNYFVTFPLELTTCAITFKYWTEINSAAWISIFLVLIIFVNLFGIKGYGEVEFVLSTVKVIATTGFIILAIIINCGGVPTDDRGYIGGKIISHQPFRHSFKGFCSVFTTAAFSFSGTEAVGLAAAEAENPRKSLPHATRQVFWRIAIFYVVGLLMVSLLVSPDDPELMNNSSGASVSPFVLAIREAGIKGLPSVFNAVIIISVISVANSCTYIASRTLHALAINKNAPSFFSYTDRLGRPLMAMIVVLSFGFLAYINEAKDKSTTVFNWLLSISGLSSFFSWGSINLCHIIFRLAMKKQGRSLDTLGFVSPMGIWGSCIGLGFNILCLIAQFYVSLFPIGGKPNASSFFQGYLAAIVVITFFIGYKIYDRSYIRSLNDIDLDTGLHTFEDLLDDEKPKDAKGRVKQVLHSIC